MQALAKVLSCALALVAPGCGKTSGGQPAANSITVFAAASLQDAMTEVAKRFHEESGIEVSFNYGGSNVLAQQIEASRQADVFLSASEEWMNAVEGRGFVVAGTRRSFLSNRLVIIAGGAEFVPLGRPEDLATLPFTYLSLADPEAVPAGKYAKEYLQSVQFEDESAWERVKDRIVPAADVRAAMALVEARPDVLGIVYRTDAALSSKVRVVFEVPEGSGPKISYSAASLLGPGDPASARRFCDFLASDAAKRIFVARGFLVIE